MKLLEPKFRGIGIMHDLWNNRFNGMNLCHKCGHAIMLSIDDRPRVYTRLVNSAHRHHVYYHGEPCKVCRLICGESLEI